jgi:peptidoglycan hydrolase-like protein with peptidoglycan-binding domain
MDFVKALLVYMTVTMALNLQAAPTPGVRPEATPALNVTVVGETENLTDELTAPIVGSIVATPGPVTPTPLPTITPNAAYGTLRMGDRGEEVRKLQNRLAELGYLQGVADGSFGGMTEEAIKAAQAAFGMEANGIADNAFQQKLFEGAAPNVGEATGYVTLSDGSTGEAVVRLQKRLAELGYYSGKADGGYGPMMVQAVKAAQAAFGLEQTGIADVAFQQHLYGSVTAPTEAPTEAPEAAADEEG